MRRLLMTCFEDEINHFNWKPTNGRLCVVNRIHVPFKSFDSASKYRLSRVNVFYVFLELMDRSLDVIVIAKAFNARTVEERGYWDRLSINELNEVLGQLRERRDGVAERHVISERIDPGKGKTSHASALSRFIRHLHL